MTIDSNVPVYERTNIQRNTNKYYTEARVDTNIGSKNVSDLADVDYVNAPYEICRRSKNRINNNNRATFHHKR